MPQLVCFQRRHDSQTNIFSVGCAIMPQALSSTSAPQNFWMCICHFEHSHRFVAEMNLTEHSRDVVRLTFPFSLCPDYRREKIWRCHIYVYTHTPYSSNDPIPNAPPLPPSPTWWGGGAGGGTHGFWELGDGVFEKVWCICWDIHTCWYQAYGQKRYEILKSRLIVNYLQ